jgi:rhodanese-related sulfurtransferase
MKILGIIALIAVIGFVIYYMTRSQDGDVVTAEELQVMIDKKSEDLQLLDVRSKEEIDATGIIHNAIHINYYDDDFKVRVENLDKEKTYVVYCASGVRSGKSQMIMEELGFDEVYNLQGGYNAWKSR